MIQFAYILRNQIRQVQHFIPVDPGPPIVDVCFFAGDAVVRDPLVFPEFQTQYGQGSDGAAVVFGAVGGELAEGTNGVLGPREGG